MPKNGGDYMYPDARRHLISGDKKKFYDSADWQHVRAQVLELDHHQCQRCRDEGRYTRADRVHHINEAMARPELALSIWYVGGDGEQRRNLISLCPRCHEAVHGHKFILTKPKPPLTVERW